MTTNGKSKFSYLLIGLGLGAIGGLMAALLGRQETRELLRERSNKGLDYLNQQAGKLRESADVIVKTMNDFKSGARPSTVMGRHAKGYTDAEIAAIASYISSFK